MRKIKMMVLAMAALAAMAISAPAASADWSTEGEPLTEEATFGVSYGYINWEFAGLQTFSCEVEGDGVLFPGNQGEMTTWVLPETCTGAGVWAGCEFQKEPESVAWPLLAQSNDIFANDVTWTWSLQKCGGGSPFNLTYEGDLTLTPDNASAISELSISGKGTTRLNGGGPVPSKVWGALELDAWSLELYGLEG